MREQFRENAALSQEQATKAFEKGIAESQILRRQSVISQLYPSELSVLDSLHRN